MQDKLHKKLIKLTQLAGTYLQLYKQSEGVGAFSPVKK